MNIIILSEYFPPSFASTGQLIEELADYLGKCHNVKVLTSTKRLSYDESNKNYISVRFSFFKMDKNKKSGKIISSLFFFIACFFYILFFSEKSSVLFIVSNPPFLSTIGFIMSKLRKQKYLSLIHDQFPEIAINFGYFKEGSIISSFWKYLNKKTFSTSLFTIVLGNEMKHHVTSLYPEIRQRDNIKIIPNWSDKDKIFPIKDKTDLKAKYGLDNKFVVQYSGNIGLFQNLEIIIYTAEILKNKTGIVFQFIGEGGSKKRLMEMVKYKQLGNVVFQSYMAKEDLNESLNCADIALITLDHRAYNLCVPSKFYGIIAAGIPVVAVLGADTDIGQEILENNSGFVCDHDPSEISDRILKLYDDKMLRMKFSENSRSLLLKKYDISIIMEKYCELFSDEVFK
jgi:glycosyltransferase involved in cell wall biosynthesis